MTEYEKTPEFFLKLIHEATILQRDFFSRGENMDESLFRIIHVSSSLGRSEKNLDECLLILKSYAGDNTQKKNIIEFLIARTLR
jgi:hypothetical protein